MPINICAFLLDPSQLKIDIDRYLTRHQTTRRSLLESMIEKFVTKHSGQLTDLINSPISLSSVSTVSSAISPISSPTLKRNRSVESSNASAGHVKKLRENLIQKHTVVSRATVDPSIDEIERYLKLDITCDDVLEFWRVSSDIYPRLASLARVALAVPATSTPSEQVFSTTGLIVNAKRTRLAPENIGKIQMIHDNYEIFRS